jgi:hypothetical protein
VLDDGSRRCPASPPGRHPHVEEQGEHLGHAEPDQAPPHPEPPRRPTADRRAQEARAAAEDTEDRADLVHAHPEVDEERLHHARPERVAELEQDQEPEPAHGAGLREPAVEVRIGRPRAFGRRCWWRWIGNMNALA